MIFSIKLIVVISILIVIVLIQLFYYWYFFARIAFYKKKDSTQFVANPISIIICARDEATNLANNLPGIIGQDYPYTNEIIVVNDNSYDDSKEILEAFQKEYKNLNVFHLTAEAQFLQGKKFPLSMGIKASKYELLLLTDADCVPASQNWISKIQNRFSEKIDVVLGYGAYKKRKGFLNKIIRFETLHTAMQYMSYALAGKAYMGVGRNLAYKKSLFQKVQGFKSHANIPSGDDDLFINQVATKTNVAISIDPETFTYSKPKTNWAEWKKQKSRHFSTGKFYKLEHKILLSVYNLSQFLFYPILAFACLVSLQNWMAQIIVLSIILIRYVSLMIVWFNTMNKLNEKDLKPYFLIWDIWLPIYYLQFLPSLFKKPKKQWK
jgi:cellulose synthase/poly-beta-1,6-N-acetylglucosamine synthase-like glycosyltransferase